MADQIVITLDKNDIRKVDAMLALGGAAAKDTQRIMRLSVKKAIGAANKESFAAVKANAPKAKKALVSKRFYSQKIAKNLSGLPSSIFYIRGRRLGVEAFGVSPMTVEKQRGKRMAQRRKSLKIIKSDGSGYTDAVGFIQRGNNGRLTAFVGNKGRSQGMKGFRGVSVAQMLRDAGMVGIIASRASLALVGEYARLLKVGLNNISRAKHG